MSVLVKLPSGNWRAQIRHKGRYVSSTFAVNAMLKNGRWKRSAVSIAV